MIAAMTSEAPTLDSTGQNPNRAGPAARERFLALLDESFANATLIKLILAKPTGAEPQVQQVAARRIELRGEAHWSFVYRHPTKDVTKNLLPNEGLAHVAALLGAPFRNAHLLSTEHTTELAISERGKQTLRHKAAAPPALARRQPAAHDRTKHRLVALERPFLAALGVTDAAGKLIPAMSRKYRQIDKFVEVFASAFTASTLAQARQRARARLRLGQGLPHVCAARPFAPRARRRREGHWRRVAPGHGRPVHERRGAAWDRGLELRAGRRDEPRAAAGRRDDRAARLRHGDGPRDSHGRRGRRGDHPVRAVLPQGAASAVAKLGSARTRFAPSCSTACTWARRPKW